MFHRYDKFGNIAKDCNSTVNQLIHHSKHVEEEASMFYACHFAEVVNNKSSVQYIDSGCNNYMTSQESILIIVDKFVTFKVKMGNGELLQATGKETLVNNTNNGTRYAKEVWLVAGLDKNLMSVGHVIPHGYFLLFGDDIFEDK